MLSAQILSTHVPRSKHRQPNARRLPDRLDFELQTKRVTNANQEAPIPKVVTQTGTEWRFFPALDISHFRALDKYVSFEEDGQEHLTTESLKRLAERLEPWGFVQIHRATLVNMAKVQRIYRHTTGYRIVLRCGQEVAVARRALRRLRSRLGL